MWVQFFLENLRFAISLFAGLVFFAVGWLYLDAWQEKHDKKELFRYLGFFLVAISFLFSATQVESTLIEAPFSAILSNTMATVSVLAKIVGFTLIVVSLLIDPIQPHPDVSKFAIAGIFGLPFALPLSAVHPLLALFVGFLYFKRATTGLERHLQPIAIAFFMLSISEVFSLGSFFRSTTNVDLYNQVAAFGPIWFARYISLLLATFVLGRWVFSYLLKRFFTQFFMIFTSSILVIFLVTAVVFSGILLGNIRKETFTRLDIDARVLAYAIETKKAQGLSDAQLVAQNSQVVSALGTRRNLVSLLENLLLSKDQSFLWALDSKGTVLARGEDNEKYGDSVAGDPLVQKALKGEAVTSISARDGAFAPIVTIQAASPIKGKGAIVAGTIIDNAFADGIKKATGFEASIYGGNTLSATTFITADGKTRPVGIKEENTQIKSQVLENGKPLTLALKVLGVSYLGAYLPLKNVEEKSVGMIFVGEPQAKVLQTAGASVELTFLVSVILLILSIFPTYFVTKFLTSQIK